MLVLVPAGLVGSTDMGRLAGTLLVFWSGDLSPQGAAKSSRGLGNDVINGGLGDEAAIFNFGFLSATSVIDLQDPNGGRLLVERLEVADGHVGGAVLQFQDCTIIQADENPLVNDAFHLASNLDVFLAGADPEGHFAKFGWREVRDSNPFFDTCFHLAANSDVAAGNIHPLEHYNTFRWRDGP
jgi:Ca2+-binding RTX toxin-like protein